MEPEIELLLESLQMTNGPSCRIGTKADARDACSVTRGFCCSQWHLEEQQDQGWAHAPGQFVLVEVLDGENAGDLMEYPRIQMNPSSHAIHENCRRLIAFLGPVSVVDQLMLDIKVTFSAPPLYILVSAMKKKNINGLTAQTLHLACE